MSLCSFQSLNTEKALYLFLTMIDGNNVLILLCKEKGPSDVADVVPLVKTI